MIKINRLGFLITCLWFSSVCFGEDSYPTTPPNPLSGDSTGAGVWSYDVKDSSGKVIQTMKLFLFGPVSTTQNKDPTNNKVTYTINFPVTPASEDQYKYIVGSQLIDASTGEIICSNNIDHKNNEVISINDINNVIIYSWEFYSAAGSNNFSKNISGTDYKFIYNNDDTIEPYIGNAREYLALCLEKLDRSGGDPNRYPTFKRVK